MHPALAIIRPFSTDNSGKSDYENLIMNIGSDIGTGADSFANASPKIDTNSNINIWISPVMDMQRSSKMSRLLG